MSNRMITFQGRTLSLVEWARKYGLKRNTLWRRLRYGWSMKDALFAPPRNPVKILVDGKSRTVAEIAKAAKVSRDVIYLRLKRGWSKDELSLRHQRRMRVTAFGRTQSVDEWSRETGIPRGTISSRLNRGWSVERAVSVPSRKTAQDAL